jgi:hypothetical protein
MQQHQAHAPQATAPIDEPLDFGTADLIALPVLLVLCLLFFLVGVWDTLRDFVAGERERVS